MTLTWRCGIGAPPATEWPLSRDISAVQCCCANNGPQQRFPARVRCVPATGLAARGREKKLGQRPIPAYHGGTPSGAAVRISFATRAARFVRHLATAHMQW